MDEEERTTEGGRERKLPLLQTSFVGILAGKEEGRREEERVRMEEHHPP